MPRLRASLVAAASAMTVGLVATPALADRLVIKQPNEHPDYTAELEPHLTAVAFHRNYGRGRYRGAGDFELGVGFRASIELADPAFIKKINNTVAITFGVDLVDCYRNYCDRHGFLTWFPVALQWNFFLTEKWSVFGEIGGVVRSHGFFADTRRGLWLDPLFELGGRYHFNDSVALTMRVGFPFVTVGASFFVGG